MKRKTLFVLGLVSVSSLLLTGAIAQAQPTLTSISPDGSVQFQWTNTLTFSLSSTSGITAANISVQLSMTNLSGVGSTTTLTSGSGLTVGGTATNPVVTAPLTSNLTYTAIITATDTGGSKKSTNVFDTVIPSYTWEAEDYDYGGGKFFDNPQTNAYKGLQATIYVDGFNPDNGGNAYRPVVTTGNDGDLGNEINSDRTRVQYMNTNYVDYDQGWNNGGSGLWGNYTRHYPAGHWNIYARCAGWATESLTAPSAELRQGGTNGTLLGRFVVPNTATAASTYQNYFWAPLTYADGNLVEWDTDGSQQTLTMMIVNGNCNFNFYMLRPAAAEATVTFLDFEFNEGKGPTTTDSVAKIVGTLGYAPPVVITTNAPSGVAGAHSIGFNLGVLGTNNSCLVVDDSKSPILAFATNAPFTMQAWVNLEAGLTNTYEGIGAYGASYKIGLDNAGQFEFTLFGIVDLGSGYYPPAGEWHHLAAAWTPGTGVALYHDGILITNLAETGVPKAYAFNTLSIGAEQPGAVGFHGLIDRFRIDTGALAATNLDFNPTNPAPVTTNTVVAYNFTENAYPFQSAGATARPAVPFDTTGPTFITDTPSGLAGDYALNFAAGQQVVVPDPTTVMQLNQNNPSFTLQAWVKFTGNPTNRSMLFYANGPGGDVSFSIYTNRTVFVTTLGIVDQQSTAAIPNDTNWHHIAVVHQNGSNLLFYVDGALEDTVAYTNGVIFTRTNQVFYIGAEPGNNLQYLGKLDRLKVTSGALAQADLDYHAVPGPELILAGSVDSGVGITFDRPVDPTTAANPANYTVTGATVEGATVFEGQYVALQLAGVPGTGVKVTVTGVKDLAGNPVNGTVSATGQLGDLISADIGTPGVDPLQLGFAAGLGDNGYLIAGGGSDIYNNADGFHFLYQPFSGAFDVRVRVEWMNPIGTGDVWAKAGLMVRESLDAGSRNVHLHSTRPPAGENVVEYTYRDVEGGSTANTSSLETPPYPNVWLRLVRPDPTTNVFNAYLSTDGGAWVFAATHTIPGALLPNRVYVGMDVTEHNNTATVPLALAVFQQFSLNSYPSVVEAARTYSLGFKFGVDTATTAPTTMAPGDVAGVPGVAQANWNNVHGTTNGTTTNTVVGDLADDTATNSKVVLTYSANGTWASTGEGEENNQFPAGADRTLMTGYLDTGAPSTTSVTISNLPTQLTSGGYDLYLYYTGGTDNDRYGGYRVLDAASGAVLKDYVVLACSSNATGFIEAPGGTNRPPLAKGNYFIFSGLTATNITIQATTASPYGGGGTPRAPLNAVQLVAPSSAVPPPAVPYELGQTVNGFQDSFSGPVRDPNWLAVSGSTVGLGSDHYQQLNGVLYVTSLTNDPNHLIYVGPGGSNTAQEVLARIRVLNFGTGDPARGGVGACVSSNVTGKTGSWIGYNLNLRHDTNLSDGGSAPVPNMSMLDDLRAWGPTLTNNWATHTWYWMRIKVDPSKPDGTNIVFAKAWLADGTTPEPPSWALKWADASNAVHGGFGGITGGSAGGLSEFEVSYILIKCATLPPINVDFSVAPLPKAYVRSVSPADGATSVAPNGEVQAVLIDGQYPINPNSITMWLNGSPVKVDVSKVGDAATITYVPDGIYAPNDTINVTLGYVENGDAVLYHWSFSAAPYTRDVLHGYIGTLEGPAFFSANGGGHTGKSGDYAINFGESGVGTAVYVADGSFLNLAAANDIMSISLWIKRYTTNDIATDGGGSSAFWATSPSSNNGERGYQAHAPWSDDNIYFDTDGCCVTTTNRINASITTFAPYKAVGNDGFWTNWHNFVFVKDTTNKFIYIDGVLFLKGTNTAALPQDFINLYMGSEDSVNNDLKGLIDDFAVYSSAVSAADAALLASGTPPTDLSGESLLAYWNFDDAADSSQRAYSIGLHFGADEFSGNDDSTLAPTAIAGVPSVMQANWNNLKLLAGTNVTGIVSDYADNTSSTTLVSVSWSSANTWSTFGRGETNNSFPAGPNQQLMLGYLDVASSGTTTVTISNLPSVLTANGYSVYVYAMGSVVGRSGGYRVLDADGAILTGYKFATATSNMFNYVQAPVSSNPEAPAIGNYLVFSGLTASNIIVQATTANGLGGGGTPRAPIQAIQLVAGPAAYAPPAGLAIKISVTPTGLVLTFSGTLQSADQITGPWTDVPATSPLTITPSSGSMKFYRVRE